MGDFSFFYRVYSLGELIPEGKLYQTLPQHFLEMSM